eukprot:2481477-Prymnesium_polylepis.1
MADLANTYGYASSMEGFSISDGQETWFMEMVPKGKWCARALGAFELAPSATARPQHAHPQH